MASNHQTETRRVGDTDKQRLPRRTAGRLDDIAARKTRGLFRLLAILLALFGIDGAANGATREWRENPGDQNSFSGSFFNGNNWSGFSGPTEDDVALFRADTGSGFVPPNVVLGDFFLDPPTGSSTVVPGGSASVAQIRVEYGDFDFLFDPSFACGACDAAGSMTASSVPSLIVGDVGPSGLGDPVSVARFLGDGALTTGRVEIGSPAGAAGRIEYLASQTWHAERLVVGAADSGELLVEEAGQVHGNSDLEIGLGTDSSGVVTISGDQARLDLDGAILSAIAETSSGRLIIEDGATVTTSETLASPSILGWRGQAWVLVSGEGSHLDLQAGVSAADEPSSLSTFDIEWGGRISSRLVRLGHRGDADALVLDPGSRWNGEDFEVGVQPGSRGRLELLDGGQVHTIDLGIAAIEGSVGDVIVDSGNFTSDRPLLEVDDQIEVGGSIYVGRGGMGSLDVGRGDVRVGRQLSVWPEGWLGITPEREGMIVVGTDAEGMTTYHDAVNVLRDGSFGSSGTIQADIVSSGQFDVGKLLSDLSTTVVGEVQLEDPGALRVRIQDPNDATSSELVVEGRVTVGGMLIVQLEGGFVPATGQALTLIDATEAIRGEFTNAPHASRFADANGVGSFAIAYGDGPHADRVTLSHFVVPEPGLALSLALGIPTLAFIARRKNRAPSKAPVELADATGYRLSAIGRKSRWNRSSRARTLADRTPR